MLEWSVKYHKTTNGCVSKKALPRHIIDPNLTPAVCALLSSEHLLPSTHSAQQGLGAQGRTLTYTHKPNALYPEPQLQATAQQECLDWFWIGGEQRTDLPPVGSALMSAVSAIGHLVIVPVAFRHGSVDNSRKGGWAQVPFVLVLVIFSYVGCVIKGLFPKQCCNHLCFLAKVALWATKVFIWGGEPDFTHVWIAQVFCLLTSKQHIWFKRCVFLINMKSSVWPILRLCFLPVVV